MELNPAVVSNRSLWIEGFLLECQREPSSRVRDTDEAGLTSLCVAIEGYPDSWNRFVGSQGLEANTQSQPPVAVQLRFEGADDGRRSLKDPVA